MWSVLILWKARTWKLCITRYTSSNDVRVYPFFEYNRFRNLLNPSVNTGEAFGLDSWWISQRFFRSVFLFNYFDDNTQDGEIITNKSCSKYAEPRSSVDPNRRLCSNVRTRGCRYWTWSSDFKNLRHCHNNIDTPTRFYPLILQSQSKRTLGRNKKKLRTNLQLVSFFLKQWHILVH